MIRRFVLLILVLIGLAAPSATARQVGPSFADADVSRSAGGVTASRATQLNPLRALNDAGSMLGGASDLGANFRGPVDAGQSAPNPDGPGMSVAINIMLLLTVITLVPSIMLMTTGFVRIMVVLALLRQAMGTQSLPPPQVITGLALFMTALVMKPTIDRVWADAVVPYQNGEIRDVDVLWDRGVQPVRDFMFDQIEATGNWSSLYMVLNYQGVDTSKPEELTREDITTTTLIPAYMLSELKTAFLMGFRVYLPFLVIDMVIASLLISMSMMMLPPVLISLPFKLMLFVLVDGWTLIVGSLLNSFVVEGSGPRDSAVTATVGLFLAWRIVHPRDAGGAPAPDACGRTRPRLFAAISRSPASDR